MKLKLLLFLLCPLWLSTSALSQTKIIIEGQVKDFLTNEAVSFATISIAKAEDPTISIQAAPSDDKGKFSLPINNKGEYILTAQYVGKQKVSHPFSVTNDKKLNLGVIFMKDDSQMLGEVVAYAQKPLVKVDLDKITYSIQDDPESKTSNVIDILRKVPMVSVDGDDKVQLKGSDNYKIYLDGKPSNMISSNPKDVLKSMPASMVKDIEVITDPGAKYDAEGVAGIINIITNKASSMSGYTATINGRGDTNGSYGGGVFATAKAGKFGFTGNFNHYKYRFADFRSNSFREDFIDPTNKYLSQNSRSKANNTGQYESGELSYEIDTLNLISIRANIYGGRSKNKLNLDEKMSDEIDNTIYAYKRNAKNIYKYASTEINADYQRSFSVKDRLLTASYKLSINPFDIKSDKSTEGIINYLDLLQSQTTETAIKEHTFQVDYTTPFAKIHTWEAGAKYILRLNESDNTYTHLDSNGEWVNDPILSNDMNKFKHHQNIFAAYTSYAVKYKKFGLKAGVRFEATDTKVKYPWDKSLNFDTDDNAFVPSATLSYQLNQTQNFRFGYNMRIIRPSIYQLNPNADMTDPSYIRIGNPDLDQAKFHTISTNYGSYSPKLSLNLNLSYTFANNIVESYTDINNGISTTTFGNFGKKKDINFFAYANWMINPKIRINGNVGGMYSKLESKDKDLKNDGFRATANGGIDYTFKPTWRANANAGYYGPYLSLLGKGPAFHYHSFSLNKSFLSERLNISISAQNPFMTDFSQVSKNGTDRYAFRSENIWRARSFSISASFKFGELKAQIKKVQRTITNDDVNKSGGGQEGQTPN